MKSNILGCIFPWLLSLAYTIESESPPPDLRLKSYKLFARNRTVNLTERPTRLPKVFYELVFECNSTLPTKWLFPGLHSLDPAIKKIEVNKWRILPRNTSSSLYHSNMKISFNCASRFINVTCRNLCDGPHRRDCSNSSVYVNSSNIISSGEDIAPFFELNYGHDMKMRRSDMAQAVEKLGTYLSCEFTLHMDLERGAYKCTESGNHSQEVPSFFINCGNPDECDAMMKRPGNTTECPLPVFVENCTGDFCSELELTNSPFILACGQDITDSVVRSFFKPLDAVMKPSTSKQLYPFSNSRKAHYTELQVLQLSMNRTKSDQEEDEAHLGNVYAGGHAPQFVCQGLKSHFAHGIRWMLRLSNGSTFGRVGSVEYSNDVDQLIVSKRRMQFPGPGDYFVICEAPNWNSVLWTNASVPLTVMSRVPPSLGNYSEPYTRHNSTAFIVRKVRSSEDMTLSCPKNGRPEPSVTWTFDGIKSKENKADFYTREDTTNSSSILLNPNHLYMEISCRVRNGAGSFLICFVIDGEEAHPHAHDHTEIYLIIGGIAAGALCLIILVILVARWKIRRTENKWHLSEEEIEEFTNGNPEASDAFLIPYKMELEVPLDNIIFDDKVLGTGAFGIVVKGQLGIMTVAIKTTKKTADVGNLKALLSELKIMSFVGRHPNIVNLLAACTQNIRKNEVYVVLEYCERGNMIDLLRKNRDIFVNRFEAKASHAERMSIVEYQNASVKKLSTVDLVRWSLEIAGGMEFLSSRNVIHGDLAGRNILITGCLKAKVSDFGLSKQLFEYSTYQQKSNIPLPLRWMAPESLQDLQFSIQSDIWSYGVVLWEIFSLGDLPYPGMDWGFASWREIQDGYRMEKPDFASDTLYNLIRSCWELEAVTRPSFTLLKDSLASYLKDLDNTKDE